MSKVGIIPSRIFPRHPLFWSMAEEWRLCLLSKSARQQISLPGSKTWISRYRNQESCMFFGNWNNRRIILCIRLDNMGDVLMSQPAMRALKQTVPGRKITLLTSSAGASIARFIPEVDEIIPFDVPWVKMGEDSD